MRRIQITVRKWGHSREGIYHMLKGVNYPIEVVQKIQQWAVNHQVDLLHAKYCERSGSEAIIPGGKSKGSPHTQTASDALNLLWRNLQREGYNSEDDRHAITFLFGLYEDNPELINLTVAQEFLVNLSSEEAAQAS